MILGVGIDVFFSSRRRHTRLQGDWSSDVCSSDLFAYLYSALIIGAALVMEYALLTHDFSVSYVARSEERRVGKEGGARGEPDDGDGNCDTIGDLRQCARQREGSGRARHT